MQLASEIGEIRGESQLGLHHLSVSGGMDVLSQEAHLLMLFGMDVGLERCVFQARFSADRLGRRRHGSLPAAASPRGYRHWHLATPMSLLHSSCSWPLAKWLSVDHVRH